MYTDIDQEQTTSKRDSRVSSIESFRSVALFAVIILHTSPFRGANNVNWQWLHIGIINATRFDLPLFFIVAGYFYGKKIRAGYLPEKVFEVYVKRLLPLFLIWTVIYAILPTDIKREVLNIGLYEATYQKVHSITSDPITLLFQGSRTHLWFMISLLMALGIITLFIKANKRQLVMPTAALVYVLGLIGGSYSTTSIGIDISFNTRNGPFFSTLFVAIGWCLSSGNYRVSPVQALVLAAIGISMQVSEALMLWEVYHILPVNHDYLLGTVLYGGGLTMYLLSKPNTLEGSRLSKWGRYTLGVYLMHLIVLDVLTPLDKVIPFPLWDIIYPFLVYFLSLLMVFLLFKTKKLKYIVSY